MSAALDCIKKLFKDLESRDLDLIVNNFTEDAVFFDPHYPVIEMRGSAAIEKGFKWGLKSMEQFGFTIVREFITADGNHGSIEVDTHHTLKGGKKLDFPQAFFVDIADGKISRLQAYEPYRPNGIMGFFLRISHFMARTFGV